MEGGGGEVSFSEVQLNRTGRIVLLAFLAFCLLGLLLFLIQTPRYYQEAQEAQRGGSLTRSALALISPTPAPTPGVSPTPGQGTASRSRFMPSDFFLLLILLGFVFFFMRKRKR